MRLDNNDPRVIQRSAPKPNVPCSLVNSSEIDCDICRLKSDMVYNGTTYFCVAHLIEARFKQEMLERKKNIQVLWANNYLVEAKRYGNNEDDDSRSCGGVVEKEEDKDINGSMGMDCQTIEPIHTERVNEALPTEATVGIVYGGE